MAHTSRRFAPTRLLLSAAFVVAATLGGFALLSADIATAHPHHDASEGGVLSSNTKSDHLHIGMESGNALVAYRYSIAVPRGGWTTDPLTRCRAKFVGLSLGQPEIRVATHDGVELHPATVGFQKAAFEFEGERFEASVVSFDAKSEKIVVSFERVAAEAAPVAAK